MAHLTQIWHDKMKIVRAKEQGVNHNLLGYVYEVSWDHPQYGQGEKVTTKKFKTLDEAKDYAIRIGLTYDLRLKNGMLPTMEPNQSRIKRGYSPLPDPNAVAAVWPLIQNMGTWPNEVTEYEIKEYCERTNTPRPQWSLPVEQRDAMKVHERSKPRVKAGPL